MPGVASAVDSLERPFQSITDRLYGWLFVPRGTHSGLGITPRRRLRRITRGSLRSSRCADMAPRSFTLSLSHLRFQRLFREWSEEGGGMRAFLCCRCCVLVQETRAALGPGRPITLAYYPDGCAPCTHICTRLRLRSPRLERAFPCADLQLSLIFGACTHAPGSVLQTQLGLPDPDSIPTRSRPDPEQPPGGVSLKSRNIR